MVPADGGRPDLEARRRWMSVLALAGADELDACWCSLPPAPAYRVLRGPEVGLVLVRARAGGTGLRFNVGETTVTRCSIQLTDGTVGHAYVGGRRPRHAERAAVLDALLQDTERRRTLAPAVVAPLASAQDARRRVAVGRSAPTRVEFFTMVRGED